jgi:hypothetical protein
MEDPKPHQAIIRIQVGIIGMQSLLQYQSSRSSRSAWGYSVHGATPCMGLLRAWGYSVHGATPCMGLRP